MITKIPNIKKIYIQKNMVSYQDLDDNVLFNEKPFMFPATNTPYIINDRFLIYRNKVESTSYSIDLENNNQVNIGKKTICLNFLKDYPYRAMAIDFKPSEGIHLKKFIELDLITGNAIQEFDIEDGYGCFAQRGAFFIVQNGITIKAKEKNTLLWEYNVTEIGRWFNSIEKKWVEGKIDSLLGVNKHLLWISLDNDLLLSIEIDSGKLIHKLESPISLATEQTVYKPMGEPLARHSQLDLAQEKILVLNNQKLVEISIAGDKPVKEIYDIEESMSEFGFKGGIKSPIWTFDDKYVYFFDNGFFTKIVRVGILDRSKKQVIASIIVEAESNGVGLVQTFGVYQDKIYLLDTNDNLWIISIPDMLTGV